MILIPKQQRSAATRDRILAAAERLLRRRAFEQLPVQDVLHAAGASVGSFYHLFGDKEALLPALYERHAADMRRRLAAFLEPPSPADLRERCARLCAAVVDFHVAHTGLLRALVLRSHAGGRGRKQPEHMRTLLPRLADYLAGAAGSAGPRQARARLAVLLLLAGVREALLFPETSARSLSIGRAGLAARLAPAVEAIVRAEDA